MELGLSWNGVCYQYESDAFAAFVKSLPTFSGSGITSPVSASIDSGTGIVHWSVMYYDFVAGGYVPRSGTFQLLGCIPSIDQYPQQTLLWIFALFFAALLGFKTGFKP